MIKTIILHFAAALLCAVTLCSPANAREATSGPVVLNTFTASRPLSNGMEVTSGGAVEQILALRDDVVRIRIGLDGQLPEDASWAVLKQARSQSVEVTPDNSGNDAGFCTRLLCVHMELSSLRLRITDRQGNLLQEDASDWPNEFHGHSFRLYKRMPEDEHYFGLGDKTGPLDRRNQAFTLWNTDAYAFQESTDPIYKSIPFFLTLRQGRSIGVLLDDTWRTSFDFGKQTRDVYSFGGDDGPVDYYVLYGPSPKQVLTAYGWLTGYTPLAPLWSLGYQQSRWSYDSDTRVREVAARLRADRIPCDVLYLDIDYQDKNRPFTIDTKAFPNFARTMADLKQQNFHVVAITDLHIADMPKASYAPYDSGVAGDHFVKNADGSTYVGKVWPGPSVFPEFTREKTREWWGTLYRDLIQDGVAGFWNDMNEPSVFDGPGGTMPEDVQHRIEEPGFRPRTASHLEIHNVYGMLNSLATYDGLLKLAPNQRAFVLTRATYAGGQRYAATWTGDNSSTWNHLRLVIPMLLNLGLSGFGLSGADVGGFVGSPQPELLTRWFEIAAFQPIDRDHTEKGSAAQEPWVHGPAQEQIRRRHIEERYRLLPYIYTAAEEMSRTGIPMMRPLFLEFPNAGGNLPPLVQNSEFLLGPDLLIAPPPFPDKLDDYQVRFPSEQWYDYWTGERVSSNQGSNDATAKDRTVTIKPSLELLPVYVRGGSIIPMQPLVQSTSEIPQGPLTLRVYPGDLCEGSLYVDDGTTMAYKNGDFLRTQFTCEQAPGILKIHIGRREGNFRPWWKQFRLEIYGWNAGAVRALLNGKIVSNAVVDAKGQTVTVEIPDQPGGAEMELR